MKIGEVWQLKPHEEFSNSENWELVEIIDISGDTVKIKSVTITVSENYDDVLYFMMTMGIDTNYLYTRSVPREFLVECYTKVYSKELIHENR